MSVAIETLHPGVYVVETAGRPRVIGVSVNTAGFVGVAEKGAIDRAILVTNKDQFKERCGEIFRGSHLQPAVEAFFDEGGTRAYIARVVGEGAAVSWANMRNSGDSGGPAKVVAGAAGPYNLDVGEHLDIDVLGYATQVFTFTGTQALVSGNGFTGNDINGKTLFIQFSGWDMATITFSGLPANPNATDVANFLNPLLQGGSAIVNSGEIDFQADQIGSGSFVKITGGTALADIGHDITEAYGTGNVPNIDSVTASDAAAALGTLQGAYAVASPNGELQIITVEKGASVSVQIAASTTASAFNFDNQIHYGWGSAGSSAKVITSLTEPFNLEAGEHLDVDISGQPTQVFTFTGTQAVRNGSGAYVPVNLNGQTLQIQFSGYDPTTITFTGLTNPAPVQEVLDYVNPRLRGGSMSAAANVFSFKADQYGSGSKVNILGGTAVAALMHAVGVTMGTGNVANVDKVTAQEVVDVVNATISGGSATTTTNGGVMIETLATGDSATIQVATSTTAEGLGFDNTLHRGSDADFMESILVRAENPGAWGNSVSIRTIAWQHELRGEVFNGDTKLQLSSIRGVSKGDILYTYDPSFASKRYVGLVTEIDVNAREVSVLPLIDDLVGIIPAGAPVQSCSQHRMSTITMEDLVDGADRITVASVGQLRIGARVVISDGVNLVDVKVTAIDGNVIRFAPVSLSNTIISGALAVSEEWMVQVLEKGVVKETHQFLSMEEESSDYFGVRLSGDTNESLIVELIDLYASPADLWRNIPLAVVSLPLEHGQDGATPTDNDFIGSDVNPRSGMYLLDDVRELNYFCIPGVTTEIVHTEMISYSENRSVVMCIIDPPRYADLPTEVYNYRMYDLNADSSYVAMYYPWVLERDPINSGATIERPPSGHMAGIYAQVASTRGVHVAPANIVMRNVLGLTYNVSDGEQDILNPVGINCIREFPGEGIRVWGARTLTSLRDGRHYVPVRRLLNFVKASIKAGNRWVVFQPIDPRLWAEVEAVNAEFLHSLWTRGMLFPSTDYTKAYFVKCDDETNTIADIRDGRVICEIGINPPFPAEFVIFRIGIWSGGTTIEEEIARRG